MKRFFKLAFALFGNYVRKYKKNYALLKLELNQAHIGLQWDIYVSIVLLLSFILSVVVFFLVAMMIPYWSILCLNYLKISPYIGSGIKNFGEPIFIIGILMSISLMMGGISYFLLMRYPGFIASRRKGKIDLTLPHAVSYMHAMSKGGMNLILIFKSLSEHTDVYGEAAQEIKYIIINSEQQGIDFFTAIKNAAATTRSDKFRDLLSNLSNITESGGDIENFFSNMVNNYQQSAEMEQRMYLELLGILAETYITVFVAGPLFLIIILIVMGMTDKQSLSALNIIVYIIIPLSAILFSMLLKIISISSDTRLMTRYTVSRKIDHYDYARVQDIGDERRIRKLMRSLRWTSVVQARKDPLNIFFIKPVRAFYLTIPASGIYFYLATHKNAITINILDDVIVKSILIIFVPYLFFYGSQQRRIKEINNSIPGFLKRLAAISDMGMSITSAIKAISKINIGILSSEVKLISRDINWTNNVYMALEKFEHRINTLAISRVATLISRASHVTGNIKLILRLAANDADLAEKLNTQKTGIMFGYLVIVYVSFFVFMLVLFMISKFFLPVIPDNPVSIGSMSISGNLEEFDRLFMHASLIQGFFSGMIGGQMMGNSISDGLFHSIFMMIIAYMVFTM